MMRKWETLVEVSGGRFSGLTMHWQCRWSRSWSLIRAEEWERGDQEQGLLGPPICFKVIFLLKYFINTNHIQVNKFSKSEYTPLTSAQIRK